MTFSLSPDYTRTRPSMRTSVGRTAGVCTVVSVHVSVLHARAQKFIGLLSNWDRLRSRAEFFQTNPSTGTFGKILFFRVTGTRNILGFCTLRVKLTQTI